MTQLDTIWVNVVNPRHAPFTPMPGIPPRCSRRFCSFGCPHSVVHSMRRRETTEWGQPNETHGQPRTACTPLGPVALQNLENVAVVAAASGHGFGSGGADSGRFALFFASVFSCSNTAATASAGIAKAGKRSARAITIPTAFPFRPSNGPPT